MAMNRDQSTSFATALTIQFRVMAAMILREVHSRFGRENFGFIWLIIEPLMLASVISSIHHFMGGSHSSDTDIDPGTFTLLGYTIFIIFRGIVNKSEGMLEASVHLFYHRMVTILDVVLARALMEALSCVCALIVLMTLYMVLGFAELPARPLYLLAGIGLMTWLSFGLSLIIASWTFDRRTAGRLVHPMTYFAIPLSGAFWTMEFLPADFRSAMEWNPMAGIFEIARYGQFQTASPLYINFGYVIAVCAVVTYIGFIAIRNVRSRLHVS
ncbi:ABC transporter permease [Sphingomonas montanisoli]|uniref:ABC transporter n=1 Tax=Sphingomonas montanisoli TaxID=2606412 RepID=A0A5D9C982_9SPHN|nr:ABC transporter permease [Sphingomonas montanisoli]TZG27956.1 ABC transporter [Sphingomonas montanisoli]